MIQKSNDWRRMPIFCAWNYLWKYKLTETFFFFLVIITLHYLHNETKIDDLFLWISALFQKLSHLDIKSSRFNEFHCQMELITAPISHPCSCPVARLDFSTLNLPKTPMAHEYFLQEKILIIIFLPVNDVMPNFSIYGSLKLRTTNYRTKSWLQLCL